MAADIGARIGIEGEANFRNQMKQITAQSKALASEMKVVESSFDAETTAQDKAAKRAEVLNKQIDTQKQKVALLADELEKSKQKYGENATQTLDLQDKLNKATAALNNMERDLSDTEKAADGYGEEVQDATKGTQEFDAAALALSKQQLAEWWGKVADQTKKVAEWSISAAKELDSGYDTIVTETGATGEALDELKRSADSVFSQMPVDMADVGSAIGEVKTRFKVTGESLEDLSKEFLKFSSITGTSVNTSVESASRLVKAFGLETKDTANVLGLLADASQQSGLSVDKLMSSLDANGSVLRSMGFSLQDSVALMTAFEESGVEAGGAMTALKKAVQNASKQGKDANQVLMETYDSIKNATTETEALQIATDTFGSKGAIVMAEGIRSGRISLEKATKSIEEYGDVVSTTYEATLDPWDKAKVAMNNLKTVGSELAGQALQTLVPAIEKVTQVVQKVSEWFRNLSPTAQKVVGIVTALGAGAAFLVPKLMGMVQTLSMIRTASALSAASQLAQAGATGAQAAATTGATTAQNALNASMWANPVVMLTAGIVALTVALAAYAANGDWAGKAMSELNDEVENANKAFEEQRDSIGEEKEDVEKLTDRLSDLQKQESLSADEKLEMAAGVKRLNELMPDLNLQIDRETGKIADSTGKVIENTEALDANFEAAQRRFALQKNQELADAALEHYTESVKARTEAETKLNELLAEQQALNNEGVTAATTARFLELQNAINVTNEAIDNASLGADTAKAEYDALMAEVEGLTTASTEAAGAVQNSADAINNSTAAVDASIPSWNSLSAEQRQTAEKVAQAYRDMEAAVTNSINSQMSMFEEFNGGAKVSTDELLKNMQSQIDGVTNWETNLTTLADRGINQGLLQYLLEMGPKGSNYVQAFVNMSDKEFERANELWEQSADIKGLTNDIGRDLKSGLANVAGSMDDTGLNIGLGLARGITSAKGAVIAAAKEMARSTRATVENELRISSPSKVFKWIGEMTGEGFAIGLEETMPNLGNILSPLNDVDMFSGRGVNALDTDALYSAVRAGAENAQTKIVIGEKEFGRLMRGMGVSFA